MKSIIATIATAMGLAFSSLAAAQSDMPLVENSRLSFDYELPRHPIYGYDIDPNDARVAKAFSQNVQIYERLSGIRQRLMKARLLEQFSQFLAPMKLPVRLRLRTRQCDDENAFYNGADSEIVMCYEYVALFEDLAPKQATVEGITRHDAIVGGIVGVMLHEAGHAASNLLRLPVLGREEDAADQIAAYLALQFGREVARTVIKGTAYEFHRFPSSVLRRAVTGTHSPHIQRKQLTLCLAYGSDPEGFEDFVNKFGWLPKARAADCGREYLQIQHAFRTTILPHVDMEMLKKVRNHKWLQPDNAK